ncbi:MAG: sigma 54-interacting transcriptional regulator, partial [Betaproteobacteria bacterium]|nr:sigma 54-interacting transcriptional regulator [Betaproteobacteria bacterium]
GETAETPVDVRLVSATHRDLQRCVSDGSFRQDLYYRLNVIAVTMPPLRERLDDLPLLVEALLARIRHDHERPGLRLDAAALERLRRFGFAGNVRELENLLHRAAAMAASDLIGAADLEPDADRTEPSQAAAAAAGAWPDARVQEPAAPAAYGEAPAAHGEAPAAAGVPAGDDEELERLAACLDDIEREELRQALLDGGHDLDAAARRLGLMPRQLQWRLRRLHLDER